MKVHTGGCVAGTIRRDSDDTVVLRAADMLSLGAAPAFAMMALLSETQGRGPADILCSAGHDASPLNGMTLMYVLMGVFHSAPWLRLVSRKTRRPWGTRPTRRKSVGLSGRYR